MIWLKSTVTILAVPALLLTLTACGPAGGDQNSSESPSPSPTVPSNASPSPVPTQSAPPVALAKDCSELLTPASLAKFVGTGFGIPDAADITAYIDKTRAEGNPLAMFADYGGLLCPVTNGMRVSELFGYSPISPADATAQKARLISEGLTLSSHLGGELYSDNSGSENVVFEYLFVGGYWFCAVDVTRLDEVVANSGAQI